MKVYCIRRQSLLVISLLILFSLVSCKKDSSTNIDIVSLDFNLKIRDMKIGTTQKVEPIIYPKNATNKIVHWKSEHQEIASIDESGLITALKEGYTNIILTSENGNVKETYNLKVSKLIIPISKITLDKKNISLLKGESIKLNYEIYPENTTEKDVYWESYNTDVVSVDKDGKVIANGGGHTKIMLISKDRKIKALCDVEVKVIPESFYFAPNKKRLYEGEYFQISTFVLPFSCTEKLTNRWYSADEKIATVDQKGKIHALIEGDVDIIGVSDEYKLRDTFHLSVLKRHVDVTGIILPFEAYSMGEGQTINVDPIIVPYNATNKTIHWTVDKKYHVYIDGNNIKALKAGDVVLTAHTLEGGFKASFKLHIYETF
ncbi:hypothetical protein E0494_03285 [Marinilabiliaceae bacterium JC040]|nr:hypothetical protein [Marinilabiliaceae bacterium JC040]